MIFLIQLRSRTASSLSESLTNRPKLAWFLTPTQRKKSSRKRSRRRKKPSLKSQPPKKRPRRKRKRRPGTRTNQCPEEEVALHLRTPTRAPVWPPAPSRHVGAVKGPPKSTISTVPTTQIKFCNSSPFQHIHLIMKFYTAHHSHISNTLHVNCLSKIESIWKYFCLDSLSISAAHGLEIKTD